MILIIGGSFQGKYQYAMDLCKKEDMEADIWDHLHESIRSMLLQGKKRSEILEEIEKRYKYNSDLIIICDEVGAGIVPLEKEERIYREEVGRICCALAKKASRVIRVICGIGTEIKHEA